MFSRATTILSILAVAEARFGQEQEPVAAVVALGDFGNPGEAATLAGGIPGVLLAAADPCDKLTHADDIVATLGDDPAVIAAAAGLVAAEQNFNPFVVSIPNICGDASLPATEALRGIIPLVDPDVVGSDTENANSEASLAEPFDATGLSVADVMIAQGFSNFTVDGAAIDAGAGDDAGDDTADDDTAVTTTIVCGGAATTTSAAPAATTSAAPEEDDGADADAGTVVGVGAVDDDVTGTFFGFEESSLGLDFGTCVPTVKFEESLNGRKAGEFTFQAIDPVVNQGQQEALNPDIIFNRICDQLINVCGAAADAVTACEAAQADLLGAARDETTANAWNEALGFAGADINPDDAPKEGLVGHT